MSNVIFRGFANIARFSGRDTRSQFWPYAGAAVALYMVIGVPALGLSMGPLFSTPGLSPAGFQASVSHFVLVSFLMFVGLVVLLAAAIARRLHDVGVSALWGLLPLPFVAFSLVMFNRMLSQFWVGHAPDTVVFMSAFASNMLYMICVVTLIVLLARASMSAPNRHG
jgi:uncharacterized membrane protein YhaH (DUF805 family)